MTFVRNEWVPGARAVFQKFAGYKPRAEPNSWLAGGKHILVDRVEWVIMPDAATASAALQNGEVDWWENPISDLVPLLRKNANLNVDIADPLGNVGSFRMNHLYPPFDNPKIRQAVMTAMNQEDYMRAIVGDDDSLWKPLPGFFTPGTPLYSEAGGAHVGKGDLKLGQKLLKEAGYKGEPVVCIVAQDQGITKAQGDITADLLKQMGFNVDFVATDWGTTGTRRASKAPPSQGGWNMFHTWHAGADCINPAGYPRSGPAATRPGSAGRTSRPWRRPSPNGSTRPTRPPRRSPSTRSTPPPARAWSTSRPGSSSATRPGARASRAS